VRFAATAPVTAIRGDGRFHRRGQPADFAGADAEAARAVETLTQALVLAGVGPERALMIALDACGLSGWIAEAREAALRQEPLSIAQEEQLDRAHALAVERAQGVNEAVRRAGSSGDRIGPAVRAARGET
jgi:hypothetical protein